MSTIRERLGEIISTAVTAFFALAVMTAVSTLIRNAILNPRPHAYGLQVSLQEIKTVEREVLVNTDVNARDPCIVNGELEDNVFPAPDRVRRNPESWAPNIEVMRRTFDRRRILVSGSIDFASCWDWNTKAIYTVVLARYETPRMKINEVPIVDAILRDVRPSAEILALAKKQDKGKELTPTEAERYQAFENSTRSVHDAPRVMLDHIRKSVTFNQSFKYTLEDMYPGTLDRVPLDIVVRFQVMSYTGYAPLREDVIGGKISVAPDVTPPHVHPVDNAGAEEAQ